MTPTTYIYIMFWKRLSKGKFYDFITYIGITNDIDERINDHLSNCGSRSTNRFNKAYGNPYLIKYKALEYYINPLKYERYIKKLNFKKKSKIIRNWKRWSG